MPLMLLSLLKPIGRFLLNPYVIIAIVFGILAWYGHSQWAGMVEKVESQNKEISHLTAEVIDSRAKITSLQTAQFESEQANGRLEAQMKANTAKLASFRSAVKNAQSPAELEALYVERYNLVLDCLQGAETCSDSTNTSLSSS